VWYNKGVRKTPDRIDLQVYSIEVLMTTGVTFNLLNIEGLFQAVLSIQGQAEGVPNKKSASMRRD
jgi:hypothetical protein